MFDRLLYNVAKVIPATKKTGDGAAEIVLDTGSTAVRVAIPSWLVGRYVEITAVAQPVDVLFGDSSIDVVYGQVSSVASEAITTHASSGRHVPAGQTRHWAVPKTATHVCFEAAGTGKLYIGLASAELER